jgi:hypothetical protein
MESLNDNLRWYDFHFRFGSSKRVKFINLDDLSGNVFKRVLISRLSLLESSFNPAMNRYAPFCDHSLGAAGLIGAAHDCAPLTFILRL